MSEHGTGQGQARRPSSAPTRPDWAVGERVALTEPELDLLEDTPATVTRVVPGRREVEVVPGPREVEVVLDDGREFCADATAIREGPATAGTPGGSARGDDGHPGAGAAARGER